MRAKVFSLFLTFLLVSLSLSCSNKEEQAQKHYKKGFEFHNEGALDKAAEEYQEAIKLNPSLMEARMNLGAIYVNKKEYDNAIQQFKKVVELNYLNARAHYNLGMVYIYQGDKDKANEELKILKNIGSDLADNLQKKLTGP
jgi:Flp pilus assembly protein TadD